MNEDKIQSFKDKVQGAEIFHLLMHARNYFSAEMATRAIGFISIPVFTRLYTPGDFGIVAVFLSYFAIFSVLIALNSQSAVSRYYFENTDDFPEFVGTTLILVFSIVVVVAPFYFFFYNGLSELIGLRGALPAYLFAACLFEVLYRIYIQILVPQKRSKEAATITVLRGYVTFGIAVLLVLMLESERYRGQIWAMLITGFLLFVYFAVQILRSSKLVFRKEHFRYIAKYSFPLIPYALSGVLLAQFDRIMINASIDSSAAGLYSLGYSIGMLVFLVNHAVQTAFTPYFFDMMDKSEFRKLDKTTGRLFSLVTLAALVLVFFAREIGEFLADESFHEGLKVVPAVVVGYLFFSVFFFYGRFIGYEKKTYYSSILIVTAGIVNIVLNAKFIPQYGYIAAAYTTLVSYLLLALLTWLVAKFFITSRETPTFVVGKPLLWTVGCLGVFYLVSNAGIPFWLMELVKVALILIFSLFVFRSDLNEVRKSLLKTTNPG
jgi:O-antigen/teichoic acid export membrane protein